MKLVQLDDLAYENARANAERVGVKLAEVLPHDLAGYWMKMPSTPFRELGADRVR